MFFCLLVQLRLSTGLGLFHDLHDYFRWIPSDLSDLSDLLTF